MLTENDVVAAVCKKLEGMDFVIKQALHTSEPDIDIIAVKNDYTLYIEAKGETSALKTSARFGKPFSQNQIKVHVSKALLAALKVISDHNGSSKIEVAIALPDNDGHRKVISEIEYALKRLNIRVFWVNSLHEVDVRLN
jgi:hypothetical protein